MSVHVEWTDATQAPDLVGPGEFSDGCGSTVDDHAILLGSDSVVVIEGSLDALDRLAEQIKTLVTVRRDSGS
jgi:hypothetical protein